eukprot:jgi/Chlat1/3156/Chrsp219S03303
MLTVVIHNAEYVQLKDDESIIVQSATQRYVFQVVARLGTPRTYGAVYAVEATAGTQVSVVTATGMYVLKVDPQPCDLEEAKRLDDDLTPWTQVEREASVLAHLGKHGLMSLRIGRPRDD